MAGTQPRPLELDLLCQKLDQLFAGRIDGTGTSPEAQRSNFLSKAIAAFVLTEEAGATVDEAVAASIDGGDDHGIDSVFVAGDHSIWLVQSKYITAGQGEPDLGDVSKFKDGVVDLLSCKWARFNQALATKIAALTQALNSGAARIRVILAHTGTAISDDRRNLFSDLEQAFNGPAPGLVRCSAFGLATLHDLHVDGLSVQPIEAEIELKDFGHAPAPYRAFYGRMSAAQLAQLWLTNDEHLIDKNIRKFKGSTTVNEGLTYTLHQDAKHFFYFNNGVTFLCEAIRQLAPLDPNRQTGRFKVEGLSIINGAQTVGAIAKEPIAHYDANPVDVMATFVCLENAPDGFGEQVTRFRNRQNAVDLEDFAALDERQTVWQNTLAMAGITYLVKEGDNDPPVSDTCFSIREAAPLLSCTLTAADWPEFLVAAKTDKKRLFGKEGLVAASSALRDAYIRVFPDSLTARHMWRAVQIGRAVQSQMRSRAAAEADPTNLAAGALPAKEILKQGTWLVLHVLFIRLPLHNSAELTLTQDDINQVSMAVDQIAQKLVEVVQAQHWNKQARSLFENKADCRTVKGRLMAALAQ